jgi:hypothetical protein
LQYVICDIVTYNKLYAKDNHKFVRVYDIRELDGFKGVEVLAHELDALDLEDIYLLKQMEALAFVGYIRLVYVDLDGIQDKYMKRANKLL